MSWGEPGRLVGVRLGVGTGVDANAGVREGVLDLAGESVGARVNTMGWTVGVALAVMHAAVTPSKPAVIAKASCFIRYAYGRKCWLTALSCLPGPPVLGTFQGLPGLHVLVFFKGGLPAPATQAQVGRQLEAVRSEEHTSEL